MKIAKRYRPELLVSKGKEPNPLLTDPYLDAKEERLVATDGRGLVALPVSTEKTERSRYLACSLLAAGRMLGDDDLPAEIHDQEVVEFGVLWPAAQERTFPDWKALVPKFRRGSAGTVTFALNPSLLNKMASAMGIGGVALTVELGRPEDRPSPIVVQPLDPDAEELGLRMPMAADGAGDVTVGPDQMCPKCRRLLAAGAPCPEHGRAGPTIVPALEQAAEKVRRAAAAIDGDGGTTVTIRSRGREVTATPAQLRAGLSELERRKAAERAQTERAADAILRNAGACELTKKDTKGPAVARKGGRRG